MIDDKEKRPPKTAPAEPRFGQTLLDDLRSNNLPQALRRDMRDTYEYYLDQADREELSTMGQIKGSLMGVWWLLKSLFFKLTPARRVLILLGLFFAVNGAAADDGQILLGFMALLFLLLLELKDKQQAQDELASGRAVQFALMPASNPVLSGWETWLFTRPANDVGGDLVDYLVLDDDRLGLALGDVAGKGLPAALMMAKLQATLRALATDIDALDDLGHHVNRILCRDGLPSRFASLAYLILSPDDGRVRLLNAGHLPPLILRGTTLDELPRGAPALGLTPAARFTEQTTTLAPGDLLLLYSDGLTEARDEHGDFFDDDRLHALMRRLHGHTAEAAGHRLLAEVDLFTGEARPSDDLSLIVLRYTGFPTATPQEKQAPLDEPEPPAKDPTTQA